MARQIIATSARPPKRPMLQGSFVQALLLATQATKLSIQLCKNGLPPNTDR